MDNRQRGVGVLRRIKFGRLTNAQVSAAAKKSESKADFGYGTQRGAEAHDRVQREAYPAQLHPRSAYASIVGDPVVLSPGDTVGAGLKLAAIERAIEKGGWTRGEWNRLYKMRDKWKLRADGQDARFNEFGNHPGGLSKQQAQVVKTRADVQRIAREMTKGITGGR